MKREHRPLESWKRDVPPRLQFSLANILVCKLRKSSQDLPRDLPFSPVASRIASKTGFVVSFAGRNSNKSSINPVHYNEAQTCPIRGGGGTPHERERMLLGVYFGLTMGVQNRTQYF